MAASPADPSGAAVQGAVLARAFGGSVIADDTLPLPASHDGCGRRFVFLPPPDTQTHAYALDIEARAFPPPEALTTALGPRALEIWVGLEVVAKLTDRPAHLVLAERLGQPQPWSWQAAGLEVQVIATPDHWIAVGRMPRRPQAALAPAQRKGDTNPSK